MFIRLGPHLHHVQVDGPAAGGAETILFVNSLGTELRIWDGVVKGLAGAVRAIRYDMRGHGLTPPAEPPYSVRDLARDAEQLIDALQVSRLTICGISVGGQVALQLANARPHQVDALILCDTSYRIGGRDMWNERIAAVLERGMPAVSQAVIARWFSDSYRAANAAETSGYRYMLEQCPVAGYVGVCAALRDADLESVARDIRCPTLVLCGDQDQATPPEAAQALADAIPGAGFQLISGAGHLPCIEHPDVVSASIRAFVRNHAHV